MTLSNTENSATSPCYLPAWRQMSIRVVPSEPRSDPLISSKRGKRLCNRLVKRFCRYFEGVPLPIHILKSDVAGLQGHDRFIFAFPSLYCKGSTSRIAMEDKWRHRGCWASYSPL